MPKATPGLFITLEGGEGTGKSTLSNGLAEHIIAAGAGLVQTREPGGTDLAEDIRDLVLKPRNGNAFTPLAEALLMNAARADHIEKKIAPAIAKGDWVICDRFADSTRAYQSIGGHVSPATLRLFESEVLKTTRPDVTFVLDAPPEALLSRRTDRGEVDDVFEAKGMDFHNEVRQKFLTIANEQADRCVVIDALLPANVVLDLALGVLSTRYPDRGITVQ